MGTKTLSGTSRIVYEPTGSNKYTKIWRLFFSIIDNQVSDPDSRGTKWIWSDYPDQRIKDTIDASDEEIKSMFPLIIIPGTEDSHSPIALDRKTKEFDSSIEIEVYSDRTDTLDSLGASIDYELTKAETEQFLSECGVDNLVLESKKNQPPALIGGIKVHVKRLMYAFEMDEVR